MKTSPLLAGIYVGLILLALNVAYALGNYSAGKQATYAANASMLMWLNGIENALDRQDLGLARRRTDLTIDAYVGVLAALKSRPAWNLFLSFNSLALANQGSSIGATFIKQTNDAFASKPGRLRPETRAFLQQAADSTSGR